MVNTGLIKILSEIDTNILLSDKPFYCKIKLGSIPFAGVDPFRLLWFRQKSKTTDAQK